MFSRVFGAVGVVAFGITLSAQSPAARKPAAPKTEPAANQTAAAAKPSVVQQYCVGCHSEKGKAGGLSLAGYDPVRADQQAEVTERMIRKLRAGMMPPPGARRPEPAVLKSFVTTLENTIDTAAAAHPNPGHRAFQRLSRAEYARSVRELLSVDVDVNAFLPPDTISFGFDNMSEVQDMSPTLMEGYLRAASKISNVAVGDKTASPTEFTPTA